MLAAIVRASLRNPRIITTLACLLTVLGAASLAVVRFDVFPDFAPPHVLVQTEAPGLDATVVHLEPPVLRELAAYTRSEWPPLASAFLESLRQSDWLRRAA